MAPEQAKGKPVDRRADIWAFGCVLFEILTARRAFEGEDITETISAVVTREPNWSQLPTSTPPSVERLLRRCLEKPGLPTAAALCCGVRTATSSGWIFAAVLRSRSPKGPQREATAAGVVTAFF